LKCIVSGLSLTEMSRLVLTMWSLASQVFNFSLSAEVPPILFPIMFTLAAKTAARKFKVEGSPQPWFCPTTIARLNFRRLGELAKRLTCLFFTRERVRPSAQLVERLTFQLESARPLMPAIGVFIHALVRGWADAWCVVTAEVVLQMFDAEANFATGSPYISVVSSPGFKTNYRNTKVEGI